MVKGIYANRILFFSTLLAPQLAPDQYSDMDILPKLKLSAIDMEARDDLKITLQLDEHLSLRLVPLVRRLFSMTVY